jgi:alkylation response protein AidB-like acyl-CoA dehydrogenase
MDRILSMTIEHANQRTQFGKPIGKLQAIQQQISIMAEQVYAVRMAAQMGVATSGFTPERFQAAMAKARTGEATGVVASIAHAVHGAMGVTEECDLQLFTRRIHEWRSSFGSESYWYGEIGSAYMASDTASSLEFIRDRLSPQAA